MVEDVERIEVEAQPEALVERKFLAQGHIEAHPKGSAEQIAPGAAEDRFIDIAPDARREERRWFPARRIAERNR